MNDSPTLTRVNADDPRARQAVAETVHFLETSAKERWAARAEAARLNREAAQALAQPVYNLIQADAAAAAALAGITRERFSSLAELDPDVQFKSRHTTFALALHQHLSVMGPPYDFTWSWGNAQTTRANSTTGQFFIRGESGAFPGGSSDAVVSATGIGLILTTDKPAIVSVRAYIPYSYEYAVGTLGLFSEGRARGGIDAAAFLDGQVIDGVYRPQVIDAAAGGFDGEKRDSGDGVIWVSDIDLNFTMAPGKTYAVPYGAWVDCDHSSGIGSAAGGCRVLARVQFVVVERFVAG
jgi:hypothetical protein